ncbi:MAG: hypothetical protein HZA10_02175 [Nitrospirae bacterium]|nr:hypothetical protein [Nitrospirota bacterium]
MEIQDRIGENQKTIDDEEKLYHEIINHWETIPRIPKNEEVINALNPLPFNPSDTPPHMFDSSREKDMLFEQITTEIKCKFPFYMLPRWFAARKANTMIDSEWAKKEQNLKETYERHLEAYELKVADGKKEWDKTEQERIRRLQAILDRNLSEIHAASIELIQTIHFPYETSCDIHVDDDAILYIHLDLPEIEDVIPTHRKTVFKNANIKEIKIDKLARNRDYFNLVIGQSVLIACTLCSALPSVPSVHIAAYTQRKRRTEFDATDTYVYDIIFPREKLSIFNPEKTSLQQFISNLHPVMDITGDMHLSAIQPPGWIKQVSKINESANK